MPCIGPVYDVCWPCICCICKWPVHELYVPYLIPLSNHLFHSIFLSIDSSNSLKRLSQSSHAADQLLTEIADQYEQEQEKQQQTLQRYKHISQSISRYEQKREQNESCNGMAHPIHMAYVICAWLDSFMYAVHISIDAPICIQLP